MPFRSRAFPWAPRPNLVLAATPDQVKLAQDRLRKAGSKLHLVTPRFEPAVAALPNLELLLILAPEVRIPILDALTMVGVDVPSEVWSYLGCSHAERHPAKAHIDSDVPLSILDLARTNEERAVLQELTHQFRGICTINAELRRSGLSLTIESLQEILRSFRRRGLCVVEPTQRAQWCLPTNTEVDMVVFARAMNLWNFMRKSVSTSEKFSLEEAALVEKVVSKEDPSVPLAWKERVAIHKLHDRLCDDPPEDALGSVHAFMGRPDPVQDYIQSEIGDLRDIIQKASSAKLLFLVATLPVEIHDLQGTGQDDLRARKLHVFTYAIATLANRMDTLSEADHCFVSACLLPPGFPIDWEDVARIQTLWKVATTPVAGEMPQAPKLGLATIDGEVRLVPQVGETLTVPSSAGHVYNGTDETKLPLPAPGR